MLVPSTNSLFRATERGKRKAMAPEARSFPPGTLPLPSLLAVSLFTGLLLPFPASPQEAKPPARAAPAEESTIEGKARLLRELDRQIEERRRQLAREEESLTSLRRALEAAKQELLQEGARLEGLQRELQSTLERKSKAEDERLEQIARVYAAMRPREAAAALEKMDDDTAAAILERLPGRSVGRLFDVMDKDRVRELTRRLERGRSPGGEK
jgi:flagellar motility protein MotE (MotC chaperone)